MVSNLETSAIESGLENLEDLYQLSPMQQGMLFHTVYEPESGAYFEQSVFTIEGELDAVTFERAWQCVVDRHSILRSSFVWEELEKPLQIVHRNVALPIYTQDWRNLPPATQNQQLLTYLSEDRGRGFDLGTAPLIRLALFQISDKTHKFVFSRHHIVLDRWSRSIVLKDAFAFYETLREGQEPKVSTPRPYGDYISWVAGQDLEEAESFWRASLEGFTVPTSVSTDYRSVDQAQQDREFNDERIQLSEESTVRLREFARKHKLTLNTVTQAAWALLLSKYAREKDVLFGVTVSGRPAALSGVESMVGLFINTLPLRVQLTHDSVLLSWLESLQEQQLALQQYEYCSLLDIQGWSEIPRGVPLFESILVFENVPVGSSYQPANGRLKVRSDRGYGSVTGYPLTLLVTPGARFSLQLVYDRAKFSDETIRRMLLHLERVLEEMVVEPGRRLSQISLVGPEERQLLLLDWNETGIDYDRDVCVQQLFERQASLNPTSIAVTFQDQQLTYAELNARANQLARYLRSLGVGPETLVGICVDRSLEMVIGLLGILKAGGAYVPLDPAFPRERLAFMIEDANLSVLLTQKSFLADLPSDGVKLVELDTEWELISRRSRESVVKEFTADNLAYVIYTSGSTGKPKGVEICHRALTNFLFSVQRHPGLAPDDVLLAVTTLSFDIAGLEIYLPLITGAHLVIVEREVTSDGIQLKQKIAESGATVMQATPTTWQMLIDVGWQGQTGLKSLCGGEALSRDLANALLERGVTLWNMYGPTETTIWSTTCKLEAGHERISIGRPIANTQIYLLDESQNPVPVGMAGELHIGGDGLARGYLNRPALTAAKFIQNPFSTTPSTRLYKTGDLARYLPNGDIEYLGRLDEQVKIRGFRIELGEIESVLGQHPSVRETVVVAREDEPGDQRLVAYVVPGEEADIPPEHSLALDARQVSHWENVWDETYRQPSLPPDPTFNITGWNSSYTGEAIPSEEMREWVDLTVERILSLRPKRVLEIGCGTGLLLFRITPHCSYYHGTDIAAVSIEYLKHHIAAADLAPGKVTVSRQSGNDFAGIDAGTFDTVILNSVVQYFPSLEYVLQVLEGAIQAVRPGGSVFLGDIRSLQLLRAFHTSVELQNAPVSLNVNELLQRVQRRAEQEKELLIDPAFFLALKHHLPQITDVEIQLKRGKYHNELTRFRYDVVLHIGGEQLPACDGHWLDWEKDEITLEGLRRFLNEEEPQFVVVSGVPNPRIAAEVRALDTLDAELGLETVGQLREALQSAEIDSATKDPEEFWAIADAGYSVEVTWSKAGILGKYDVFIRRQDIARTQVPEQAAEPVITSWRRYANSPARENIWPRLVSDLRQYLQRRLPEYMVPAAYVELSQLPLTPNGKIDRRALPAPGNLRPEQEEGFVAPRTATEEKLASIWQEVLKLDRVGINDNFFDLGGHSLLATQAIGRIRSSLQIDLPLRALFEAPTIKGLSEKLQTITAIASGDGLMSRITPVSRNTPLPLSFAQQRLWFLNELEGDSAFYNVPWAVRLQGKLDVKALKEALDAIVQRHETLRTTFTLIEGQPFQVISDSTNLAFSITDISELPNTLLEDEAKRLGTHEARQPFDLQSGQVIRARLLRLRTNDHILCVNTHHIVSDGWSIGIFLRELTELYESFVLGRPHRLPELAIQYADYAVWQRKWLQGQLLEQQLTYWKEQLRGIPALLELPKDRPRPAVQTFHGATRTRQLKPELTKALNDLSQVEGVTLFMTLLAAFQLLLSRYAAQEDIVVGSPIAGRNQEEIEPLIGFFVNTLLLRTDLSGNPSFQELLGRVREVALGAYANQELPFEKLVDELQPQRTLSHAPLFQVMFALQNAPRAEFKLSGLSGKRIRVATKTSKFDLTLFATEIAGTLNLTMEYNSDLFDEARIERMLEHLGTLLEGVVRKPEARIGEFDFLSRPERERLLVDWNQTTAEYNAKCVHELFEEQVEQTPDAPAVIFEKEQLTYRELNQLANQLAHYLKKRGVGPEVLVGICLERSLEMVVGLLGILKAGGAYVPLDPAYPAERLQFMLVDANARLLLTQQSLLTLMPETPAEVVCLDMDWAEITKERADNPATKPAAENLAYVLYTSGSTGRPKGVMISHRAISNHMLWMQTDFPLSTVDRVLQKTPFSFDASVWEFYAPLLTGAQLVMAQPGAHQDSAYLVKVIAEQKITILQLVPTMLQLMLDEPKIETCDSLRHVFCGGEALSFELQEQFFRRLSGAELINLYGPTEATIDATYYSCQRGNTVVPIGRPVANTMTYVLDRHLNPLPVGIAGELYIGGAGLARGYLKRPELAANSFVPDPFSAEGGGRLYKTGDLAQYLDDGNIQYLGRIDNQVKLRGFRIELGEIEAVIKKHPQVSEAIVLAREDEPGDRRLVAYAVPNEAAHDLQPDLQSVLSKQLPEYMRPSQFVFLDAFPLTPNAKIDRSALPAPEYCRRGLKDGFSAPRNATEEKLASIWEAVLKVDRVGITDNFFELGGHSLLATQAIGRIRNALQIELPLRALFEAPTIEGLSEKLRALTAPAKGDGLLSTITPVSRATQLPLSFAQQRLWFLNELEGESAFYNIPWAVRLRGELDVEALRAALDTIVERHEVLRTSFTLVDEKPFQIISGSTNLAFSVTDLSELPEVLVEDEAKRLGTAEARQGFDLQTGPLIRGRLLRLRTDDHVLCVTAHHIVSDGWSISILVRELTALYESFLSGRPHRLPELAIQYADYAVWQRNWLQGEVLERQLTYWKEHMRGAPAALELPKDRPRPAVPTFRGANSSTELSAELTQALNELSRQEGVTLFMTLLAAFQVLLWRYSSQTDIVVGSPIAGRNQVETEGLIGLFVNTLMLRTDVSGNPSFSELLERVKEVALGAYANQEVPFEKLVDELQPERNLSHAPLFQVMFVLQNAPRAEFKLKGLTLTRMRTGTETSKFDLTLFATESAGNLKLAFEYNTDLFDEARIDRMLEHFRMLLEGVVRRPETRIGSLEILTKVERERLLVDWNQTAAGFDTKCIHELFEQQVERTPEEIAVVAENGQLTYKQLNSRANQLAHYLKQRGVGPEVLVGICVERSPEMVVGLLGIMKAGGAYVPLDQAYPAEQLRFMLEDSSARLLLTQQSLLPLIAESPAQVICLDSDWPEISQGSEDNTATKPAAAENLAYVIYTSGSTGEPKGVMVTHRGLANYLHWSTRVYPVAEGSGSVVHSPLSFDLTVTSLLVPLVSGQRVTLLREDEGIEQLADALSAGVDHSLVKLTPSHLEGLSNLLPGNAAVKTRALIVGGEALFGEKLSFWGMLAPETRIINEYGPTETVVGCCVYEVAGAVSSGPVPIGRPIANTKLYVLDDHFEPQPVGVQGELYIGGAGVARGYVNEPKLTAEKFIPDPFSNQPGERLYRSGDLVRYLDDGNLEYIGRRDHQVKLRGYRIELAEIEAVLNSHSQVRDAVVLAREDEPGMKQLVGYVAPYLDELEPELRRYFETTHAEAGQSRSYSNDPLPARLEQSLLADLRKLLKQKLPEHMAPSEFVFLTTFPLTGNGKVDRNALPRPDRSRSQSGSRKEPRNDIERQLADIWTEVLRRKEVGIDDNFFQVGGHSLLATQVISRVRERFKIQFPLRSLFEFPTIAGLAAAVGQAQQKGMVHSELQIKGKRRDTSTLLKNIDNLSAEQIDSLLSEVLGKVNTNQ